MYFSTSTAVVYCHEDMKRNVGVQQPVIAGFEVPDPAEELFMCSTKATGSP
jgi:hypothetical protein